MAMIMDNPMCKTDVKSLYANVVNDVIINMQETFIKEGMKIDVLSELQQTWELKLKASRAIHQSIGDINEKQREQLNNKKTSSDKVPIQIFLPSVSDSSPGSNVVTIEVPTFVVECNYVQKILSQPMIQATLSLPPDIAASVLQHHVDIAILSLQQATLKPPYQIEILSDTQFSISNRRNEVVENESKRD